MQIRTGARELGLIVAVLAALSRYVSDTPLWAATALIVVVAAAGTAGLHGESWPWRWPLDRVVLPSLAAFAAVGCAQLMDLVPWLGLAFVVTWLVVTWVVGLELAGDLQPATTREAPGYLWGEPVEATYEATSEHPRATSIRLAAFGLAFLGFAAVGGIVPGALDGTAASLTAAGLIVTVVLDVLVAAAAGYRIATLDGATRRELIVAVYFYVMVIGAAGFAVRIVALPRLFGPALLGLLTYVVTSLRESREPLRRNRRLLEETALLGVAAVVLVAVGLLAR